jgi:hypothetical protein
MYKRKIEARSRNQFCRRRATNISHSECVAVALVNQYAKRMCRITQSPRGLSGSTIFFHII